MAAERVYPPPPPRELEFRSPSWYVPWKRWPGKLCLYHDRYCETVERDLQILNPLSPKEKKKKKMQKKERKERRIKMEEYLRELRSETEAKQKRKRKREQKKLRRKKMMMTEEEKMMMEEEKMMMKEKEKEWEEKRAEEWRKGREEDKRLWRRWEREQKMKSQLPAPVEWTIKKGDKFDITQLLSSPKRDYLIKNNGDKVKIKELWGKHVLLYFWWLYDGLYKRYGTDLNLKADLEEIYRAYNPVGAFEVVFVALGKNEDDFNVSFSRVPYLAIPHKDQKARDLLRTKFAIPFSTSARAVLFAPDGTVLLKDCGIVFRNFGAEGFPFTKQKRHDICREADALWDELVVKKQKVSLNALLGDYIISSEGDQVSTSSLEGKIVGLYFFEVSYGGFERTRELLKIWKKAKDRLYENFEIVFINESYTNLSLAKDEFKKKFRCTIPWYSLAVDGRKLCEVFKIFQFRLDDSWNNAGYFIVLQPDKYQPISYFAFNILEEFGIEAYPFTLEKAVMIEKIKQQEKLVLGKLLSPSAPLCRGVSSCFKEDTTVSGLLGKRVILFFATHSCYKAGLFLTALKRMYCEKKGTEDDFEIIYISLDCDESPSSFPLSIQEMPWLVHSYVPDFAASLAEMVFEHPFHLPAIAAFGPDGHLVTKESKLALKKEWNSMYPFIEVDMGKEVHTELQIRHNWDLDILK